MKHLPSRLLALPFAAGLLVASHSSAQLCERARLTASDGATGDRLGHSIAFDGTHLVAGALYHSWGNAVPNAGASYVFVKGDGGWSQEKLSAQPAPVAGDQFGQSVGFSYPFVMVGAPYRDDKGEASGAVYVFKAPGFEHVQTIHAPDADAFAYFGSSLSTTGNLLVVGAPGGQEGGHVGAAYIYRSDGDSWLYEFKLDGAGVGLSDQSRFGQGIATNGNRIVVGAHWADVAGVDSGAAFVYDYFPGYGWLAWPDPLLGSSTDEYDSFGTGVGLDGNRIIVTAAEADNDEGVPTGTAYIFRLDGGKWVEEGVLPGSEHGAAGAVIAGGYAAFSCGDGANVARLYELLEGQWVFVKLFESAADGPIGFDLAVHEGQVATSSQFAEGNDGEAQGAAFVFTFAECDCPVDFNHDGVLDLFDFLSFINAFNAGCP